MTKRLLVMGAGGGATNNLIRSLRRAHPSLHMVGCHHNRFTLKQSQADRSYLIPPPDHSAFVKSLNHLVERERSAVIRTRTPRERRPEGRPGSLARLPSAAGGDDLCQDSTSCAHSGHRGISVPATHPNRSRAEIELLFEKLSLHSRVWCRLRPARRDGAISDESRSQVVDPYGRVRGITPHLFPCRKTSGRDSPASTFRRSDSLSRAMNAGLSGGALIRRVLSLAALSRPSSRREQSRSAPKR